MAVAAMLIVLSISRVFAGQIYNWKLDGKNLDAVFYGGASYDKGELFFKDIITYYAHISGTDRINVTEYNPAKVTFKDKNLKSIFSLKVYYGHEYNTSQKQYWVSGNYIKVYTEFDGNSASGIAED